MPDTIRVKSGDTLSAIAKRHGTTVAALVRENGIKDANRIKAGQTIVLPTMGQDNLTLSKPAQPGEPAAPAKAEKAEKPAAPEAKTHGLKEREIDLLVRAVAAEARGEDPKVWTAVAQTILNYSRKNRVPLPRLVRSTYLSSNFDHNRRFYTMPSSRIPNYQAMREAVLDAARGESPIGRRSHFHDNSIRTPRWGDRASAVRIGKMVFVHPRGT